MAGILDRQPPKVKTGVDPGLALRSRQPALAVSSSAVGVWKTEKSGVLSGPPASSFGASIIVLLGQP